MTITGEFANSNAPVPVSSVTALARFVLEGVAKNVAIPEPRPETPVLIGKLVAFIKLADCGVPKIGVTNVGLVLNTKLPEPVSSVINVASAELVGDEAKKVATPEPSPEIPVLTGRPVALVKTA